MSTLVVIDLKQQTFEAVWQAMRRFTDARDGNTLDQLWLLEHQPIFTLGQAGKWEHILQPGNIPIISIDRGGQVTYHGPGQIIAYILVDIRRKAWQVRQLVTALEQAIIDLLQTYHIAAYAKADAPGVYVGDAKLCSIGLRIRKGCSYHGLALNVAMDLEPFTRINPCGYQNLRMTQLKDLCTIPALEEVKQQVVWHLAKALHYTQIQHQVLDDISQWFS